MAEPAAGGSSLVRKTAVGTTWMVAWRMVTRVLGLASTLVLARLLVPADFGLVAMATTFAAAIDSMSQIGVQDALVRRRGAASELFDTAFSLQLGRAMLTAALLVAGGPAAVWWFDEPRLLPVLLVLAAGALISGCENIGIVEFRRDMRFDVQFRLLLAPRLLQVALTIPLAVWLHSYWALLAGIVIGKLARTAMTYRVHSYRPRLGLHGWRELAGFSFWTWATALASVIWDRCDPFVLGPPLGPAALGVYLLALELAILPVTELVAPAAEVLFASFSSAQRQGESSVRIAPSVALALLVGILPFIITISCASGYIVAALLGPTWKQAQPLVAVLAWQSLFSPFSWVATVTLVANGFLRRNFNANLLASFIKLATLISVVSLTTRLDVVAAATASCVAAESAVFLLLLKGTGDVRLRDIAGGFVRAMAATAVTVAGLYCCGLAWRPVDMSSVAAFACAASIGVLTLVLFSGSLLSIWYAAGRPEGPESRLITLLRQGLAYRR